MDPSNAEEDFYTLAEEKFDFDVSLSPASSREDEEDEVFVGPGKGKVICVGLENLSMDTVSSGPSVGEEQMWSPLPGDDFDRMSSEAQKLATRLKEDQQPHTGQTDGTVPAERQSDMTDDFVQDTGAKLDMFSKPFDRVLSPIKRETFCVQDSPLKQLPPAIQKRLLKGRSSTSSVCSGVGVKSTRARLSTSSPASGSKTQPKMALRSKAGLGTSGILPSKPVVPAATSATSLKTAKTSVPAEKASRLAPSSKVGLRSKAPPLQTRGVVLDRRRNTSSSFSSVSSVNSSMSISPTGKGKLSTSMNTSISGPSSRAPTNMSRLASTSAAKTRRSTLIGRAADPPAPPTANTVRGARRSISVVQSRKTSETDPTTLVRSTPVKRAVPSTPTPFQQSPAKRASVSGVNSQQLGQRSKPVAFIAPTPSTRLKGLKRSDVVQSPDSLKIMKPKRLRSAGSLDSLLQEPVVPNPQLFHRTPSMSKIRCPSALPTPVNRRISGIPAMTPNRLPGSGPASTFVSARRTRNQSPAQVESATSEEELVFSPKIQPFSVENAAPAGLQTEMQNEALTCVKVQRREVAQEVVEYPEENKEPPQEVVEHPEENQEPLQEVLENQEPKPSGNLIECHSAEEVISEDHGAKTLEDVENLLLDVPVSFFQPEDKPLIDLSNTPDLIRTVSHKAGEIQLIDLTSPLIKWSPEDKKENVVTEAPLINFSF